MVVCQLLTKKTQNAVRGSSTWDLWWIKGTGTGVFPKNSGFPLLFIIPSMLNTDLSSDVSVVGPFDNAVLRDVVSPYPCNYLNYLMLLKHFLLWCMFNDILGIWKPCIMANIENQRFMYLRFREWNHPDILRLLCCMSASASNITVTRLLQKFEEISTIEWKVRNGALVLFTVLIYSVQNGVLCCLYPSTFSWMVHYYMNCSCIPSSQ